MSNERPFEVGNLVTGHTIYRPVIKTIATITKVFNGEIAVKMDDSDFILRNNEFIVNYIRKPRKGSKEARDIVAVACLTYIMMLDKKFRHLKMVGYEKHEAFLRAKEYAQDTAAYDIYQEQKAMLK